MSYFIPYIDHTGIHLPTYEDRLEDLCASYRSIFGLDAELSESVPDYQLLSVFAKALDDVSALVLQAYNSRNPAYAAGTALDLLLPQYGLARNAGESDASVRERIGRALAAKGTSTADALIAAVRAVPNVRRAELFVNDTASTDANGIPAHSVAVVVDGGNAQAVADAVWAKKAPGVGTYGSTAQAVTDSFGQAHNVQFSRVSSKNCFVYFTIKRLAGCDDEAVTAAIAPAVADFANGLGIAVPLIVPQLYAVAYAAAPSLSRTFAVADIQVAVSGGSGTATREKVDCAWNQKISVLKSGGVNITFEDFG